MELKDKIASFLKERRQELNLTMEEVAILVYEDPRYRSHVSNYENGLRTPSLETLERFSKALKFQIKLHKS